MKKNIIFTLILTAALLVSLNTTAKIHHVIAGFSSLTANATTQVFDPRGFNTHIANNAPFIVSPGYKRWTLNDGTTWHDVALKNRLVFYIKPNENCANQAFTATVLVEMRVYNYHNNVNYTFQTVNKTLTINYTPTDIYSRKVVCEINGGYETNGRIISINSSNPAFNNALALDIEYEVESYVQFNPTTDFPTGLTNQSQEQTKSEYKISWQPMAWAESYDLEWTFVDYYASFINKSSVNTSYIPANIFQFNSTRINTTTNTFSIPAVYGRGYILYRIRGIGKSVADQFKTDVVSIWNKDFIDSTLITSFDYFYSDGLQTNLNWQFSTVFAEEGKNKVSVKYYDGTLRERQAISKMNTGINMLNDNGNGVYDKEVRTSIVAENIYDHQGRPAINILPVPTNKETLKFYTGFNLNTASTPLPYDKYNFDIDRSSPCSLQTEAMSTTSGAANYYSSGNVFLTSQAHPATNKMASFIPSAAGYPFVQTLFMPDNTGKVKAQSGTGPDFQIGSGRETRYFYGRPFQEELDRLFAADAGYAEHYKKNVIQDPNGQLSISYLNLQDKVVATSLVGPAPLNVDELSTKTGAAATVTVDLLNKVSAADHMGKGEVLNLNNQTRVLSQDFFVADEGIRNFTYKLINTGFQQSCTTANSVSLNFCYECVLDLKISLKNECGVEFLSGIGTGNTTTRLIDRDNVLNSTAQTMINNCAPETVIQGTTSNYWQTNQAGTPASLAKGSYSLNKVLSINQKALDKYTQLFLKSNTCLIEKKNQFIQEEKLKMDTTMCNFDCTKWLAKLGATYASSPLKTSISEAEWTKLFYVYSEQCNLGELACKGGYNSMIADVSPMGQYGELYAEPASISKTGVFVNLNNESFAPERFHLSVYNERNVLPWKNSISSTFGASGYHPSWRFPYNPDAAGSKQFNYLNEFGEIDYVYITKDDQGVYYPKISEDNYDLIEKDPDGKTKILPKYLLDVKQFVELWQPSWAKSLVVYHPEYPFYVQCMTRSASNVFDDSWLNTLTVSGVDGADAKFNTNGASWLHPAGVNGGAPILDPFMNTVGAGALSLVRDKLINFIKTPYRGPSTFLSMEQAAVIIANNPSIDIGTCGNTTVDDYLTQYGGINTPEEWAVYRQLYMSIKQQVLEAYSVQRAVLDGYYNGCFGVESFNAFNYWFFNAPFVAAGSSINYQGFAYVVLANTQFSNPQQPCNFNRYWLYKNKTPRYPQTKLLYELDQLKNNSLKAVGTGFNGTNLTDFLNFDERQTDAIVKEAQKVVEPAMYNNHCGQCPVAESMVQFLNSLIQNQQLIPNSPLIVHGGCDPTKPTNKAISDELLLRLAGANLNQGERLEYSTTTTTNKFTTFFKVRDGSNNLVSTKSIVFNLPAGYTPAAITQFCCVKGNVIEPNHDSLNFTVSAFVKPVSSDPFYTGNGAVYMGMLDAAGKMPLREVTINGATKDVNLINCNVQPLCKPSAEAKQIPVLFNALLQLTPNKLTPGNPLQVSVERNADYQLVLSPANPTIHQFFFTDALAKALFPGKFDMNRTLYYWKFRNETINGPNKELNGEFVMGSGASAVSHAVSLSFPLAGLTTPVYFDSIVIFNGIEPLLGYRNQAVLKAIISDNGVQKLIDVTITFGSLTTGNCTVGLPLDLESGQAANNKGTKVKPDVGIPTDYGIPEFNPTNPTTIPVIPPVLPNDCTTPSGVRNIMLNAITFDTINANEQIKAGTPPNVRNNSNLLPSITFTGSTTRIIPVACGDCGGIKMTTPLAQNMDGLPINSFTYTRVASFNQIAPNIYEAQVMTRQGVLVPILFEIGSCLVTPTSGGIGDGEDICMTDKLDFHNFKLYLNNVPPYIGNITDPGDPDYEYRNSWKRTADKDFMDCYNKDFTSDLDTFVLYRFDPVNYPLPPGRYSIAPLVTSVNAHYGGQKDATMVYRLAATNTWSKVWSVNKTMPTEKGKIFKLVLWHKNVGFNGPTNLDALKLRFYLNGIQTSVLAAEHKTFVNQSWTRYEMLYIPTGTAPTTTNVFEIYANTSDIDVGGMLSDITVIGGCKIANCCPLPMPEVARVNPCNQQLMDIATQNAELRYAEEVRKTVVAFQKDYVAKCLNVYEEFFMRYQDTEDHTTLYYYDQAGNLVRTVPPKGVVKITNAAQLAKIKQDRAVGIRTEFTQHNLKTTYAYNSLNQLVNQSTPDNETMDIWQAENKRNGIPTTYAITAVKFTDKRNGVLTANDGTNGHIYRTTNAGESWSEVNALGLPDINSAVADNGNHFIVGNNGLVMHKLNGNSSGDWEIRTLPTSAKLIKVSLHQVTSETITDPTTSIITNFNRFKLWVTEENGSLWLVDCKVNTDVSPNTLLDWSYTGPYTNLAEQLDEPLTDISIPLNPSTLLAYPHRAFAVTGGGRIYVSKDYGFTWETVGLNRFVEENLNTLHVTPEGFAYIGGVNGVLLKGGLASGTTQLPARWTIVPNNLNNHINKLYFVDKEKGFALCNNNILYRTTNGGLQFTEVATAGATINNVADFSFTDDNVGTLITEGGSVYITVNSGITWQLYGTTAIAINGTQVFTGGKIAKTIRCVKKGIDLHVLVTGTEGIGTSHLIYCNKQAATAAQSWTSVANTLDVNSTIGDIYMSFDALNLKAHILINSTANGNIRTLQNLQTPTSASLISTSINSTFNASKMYFTAFNKGAAITNTSTKVLNRLDGTLWSASNLDISWNVNALAMSPNNSNALFIGNAGEINAVEGINGATVTTISVKKGVQLPALNAVSAAQVNMVAAGNNGWAVFAMQNGLNEIIKIKKCATNQHLRAALLSNSTFVLAGNSNARVTGTINPVSSFAVASSTATIGVSATDYRAIISPTIIAGTNGFVSGINNGSNFTTPTTANTILCGFDYDNVKMIAGQNGFVAFASNTTFTRANTINPLQLNEVFFVNTSIGYAGGENGSFWKTKDGGVTWNPMNIVAMTNTSEDIKAIHFTDELTGFVTGEGGSIYKTSNGGTSFATVHNGSGNLNDIEIHPSGTGYAVGNGGVCLRTTNGGNSWVAYDISTAAGTTNLNAVSVPDYNVAYISGNNSLVVKIDILQGIPVSKLSYPPTSQSWPNYLLQLNGNPSQERNLNEVYFIDRQTGYAMGANGFLMKTTDGGSNWRMESAANTASNLTAFAPTEGSTFFAVGAAGTAIRINDFKDRFASRFYYDALGRLIVSQNAKQYNKIKQGQSDPTRLYYSYTLYDFKGRITEVGEILAPYAMEQNLNAEGVLDDNRFQNWVANGEKTEVTRTYYDVSVFEAKLNTTGFTQQNLRNRVTSTAYYPVYAYNDAAYLSASHYTYDIHGNVSALVQENTRLAEVGHQYKRLDYTYDLISGKVLEVAYQHNKPDRFYHQYFYDGDNRITSVKTSYDKVVWETDAKYQYYLHGPLARTELGHDQVQGLDYAYTLQGWLKSVNGSNLDVNATNTIGRDGVSEQNNANAYFAKDEMAFELKYYNNDYTPISTTANNSFASVSTAYQTDLNELQLYNGNISGMVTTQRKMLQTGKTTLATAYSYDQLNRLAKAEYYTGETPTNWAKVNDYKNTFVYDANGNIINQLRNGSQATGVDLDDLTYVYYSGTNKLKGVNDTRAGGLYNDDIDNQNTSEANYNYLYDELGNLIEDKSEEIANIAWNTYGKITRITRVTTSTKPDLEFEYDPAGNRILKIVIPKTGDRFKRYTFYVRDAQGNVMATYTREYKRDVNYNALTYEGVNNQLMAMEGSETFNDFINWLHVESDNGNAGFIAQISAAMNNLDESDKLALLEASGAHATEMLRNIGGLYTETVNSGYLAGDVAHTILTNGNIRDLVYELCECYAKKGMDFANYFFLNNGALGDYGKRELFIRFMFNPNNTGGPLQNFASALGYSGSLSDIESITSYLVSYTDQSNWVSNFNAYLKCDQIADLFSTSYANDSYGQDVHRYLGATFSELPDIQALLTQASPSGCSIPYPSQYNAAAYFGARSDIMQMLFSLNAYHSAMFDWLISNRTSHTLSWLAMNAPEVIQQAQTNANPYGSIENYLNLIKQYYGQTFYNNLFAHYATMAPAFRDLLSVSEQHIYGSSRLGIHKPALNLSDVKFTATLSNGNFSNIAIQNVTNMSTPTGTYTITRGQKQYELSNHLGNVLVVVSDKKITNCPQAIANYDFSSTPNLNGDWYIPNSFQGHSATISVVNQKLKLEDNVTATPHARLNYFMPADLIPNRVYKTEVDIAYGKGGGVWFLDVFYGATANSYGGSTVRYTLVNGTNNITFTAPGYVWRYRFIYSLDGDDIEYTFDNFKITDVTTGEAINFTADVLQTNDYSPFGAPLVGRSYTAPNSGYRYGFNGQEKDDEVSGAGNTMSAEFWEYDSRLGRRWNLDPVVVVGESEYSTFTNNPILFIDPDGDYSRLGAYWRNIIHGGKGISKSRTTGEWGYDKDINGGVMHRDGLTKSERQTRVNDFKKTHVYNSENGEWVRVPAANAPISIKTKKEAGVTIPITYSHPILAPLTLTLVVGKLTYDLGYKIGMNIEFYSAQAAVVLSNVIPAEYLMPPSVHTKGGKQNKYDHELSPLTLEELYEKAKGASAELKRKIDGELKRRRIKNKQSRDSRGY